MFLSIVNILYTFPPVVSGFFTPISPKQYGNAPVARLGAPIWLKQVDRCKGTGLLSAPASAQSPAMYSEIQGIASLRNEFSRRRLSGSNGDRGRSRSRLPECHDALIFGQSGAQAEYPARLQSRSDSYWKFSFLTSATPSKVCWGFRKAS